MGGAAEITGWESYAWLEGGFFLVHRWEMRFEVGGHPVVDGGYEFFDYDAQAQAFRTLFFNSLGPYDPDSSGYAGTFEGESLVVLGPARISRRSNADGTITVDSDVPAGEDTWLPFMTYTLTRKS